MATMVKEKNKGKKKSKEKSSCITTARDLSPITVKPPQLKDFVDVIESGSSCIETSKIVIVDSKTNTSVTSKQLENATSIEETIYEEATSDTAEECAKDQIRETNEGKECDISMSELSPISKCSESSPFTEIQFESTASTEQSTLGVEGSYRELSNQLKILAFQNEETEAISREREELAHADECLRQQELGELSAYQVEENVLPSAPCFEEIPQSLPYQEEVVVESKPRVQCMSLDDAIRLCGGMEMEEVRKMSESEEALVAAGPVSGPGCLLFELLPTFRTSLIEAEKERIKIACGFVEEEKSRNTLWKIEKSQVNVSEKCPCGLNVDLKVNYEHAELNKARLPIAKMGLQKLLRDTQESYCHYQHLAMLAHCQIEEILANAITSEKSAIREALSLVLSTLRLSHNAPDVLAVALERWAAALSAALVDNRDLRHLLFLMHHLFRHSPRSVQWAWPAVNVQIDSATPWRVLALLELLLYNSRTDAALECTEDLEEAWEEVDKHGGGGAVSDDTLRERDLLALLLAFPLRDLVARLLLFTHNDVRYARAHEWGDRSGGRGVLKACCGVRALLHVLHGGARAHPRYLRLRSAARDLAVRALHALACLHLTCRLTYDVDLDERICAELEAAFCAGFNLLDKQELHRLPATLLSDSTAELYCTTNMVLLHGTSPLVLEQLSIELPVVPCEERVRLVAQAAIDRTHDRDLAIRVIHFLLEKGITRKSVSCKGTCDVIARECLERVLDAHAYLHTVTLQMVESLSIVESQAQAAVCRQLARRWRPSCAELRAVLGGWAARCLPLLEHLLLAVDCTPHVGLPLDVQLSLGSWLCRWAASPAGAAPEWCWAALRRLRLHRTCWELPLDAPAPEQMPTDLFSIAYALMATSWGHCIPVICSEGVSGLCKLASSRPRDAVQCLSGVMLVMAHSPESIALTPMFTEVFTTLLSSAPSLVQRALGRGGVTGSELLLRLMLAQLVDQGVSECSGVLRAWLQAAGRPQAPAARALLDAAAAACRLWPQLDAYAASLMQEENAQEHINVAVRNATTAPLLCECILRACHAARECSTDLYPRLLRSLHQQRMAGQKIHVDNALQQIGASISSEELVIYQAAYAALVAPMSHPSHLALWRLLMHLYLQKPPDDMSAPALGPQIFSGLLKSRTLGQIKRRLKDTITYHQNAVESLKVELKSLETSKSPSPSRVVGTAPVDDDLIPALTLADLIDEPMESSDPEDSTEESDETSNQSSESTDPKKSAYNLISYHAAAERLICEYLGWIEDGDKVRAEPHHADIARFIPEQALEVAWKRSISRPPPSPELDDFPVPKPRPPSVTKPPVTPFDIAVTNILKIKDRSRKRHKKILLKNPVLNVDYSDARSLTSLVDTHLKDVEKLAQEWQSEVIRVSTLDTRLWDLVGGLRVKRQFPPVRKSCANKCKSIIFMIQAEEWCISEDATRGVMENRNSARAALRRLVRARPRDVRTASKLHFIVRNIRSNDAAMRVIERVWRSAGSAACENCAPAKQLLQTLVTQLAERWVCTDGGACAELLGAWSGRARAGLQQALCGALLLPRALPLQHWARLYTVLLAAQLPSHIVFSYLSKFEMTRWAEAIDSAQHREMLEALITAVQRWGPKPDPEHSMLVELIGVHTGLLVHSREFCLHITRCTVASMEKKLPPPHWGHIVRAVDAKAATISFDDLGLLLRRLGELWWQRRSSMRPGDVTSYAEYAAHVARLLHSLLRAFVGGALRNTYEPARVAWNAWSALQESWGPWVCPLPAGASLLPAAAGQDHYTPMLRHFVDSLHQIMLDCPGIEVHLLQQIFEWCTQTYVANMSSAGSHSRVQAGALLAELAKLPWAEHQWFYGKCLMLALRMSSSMDKELTAWCCATWSGTTASTLLAAHAQGPPRLASLLHLFTGTHLPHAPQLLEEVCKLPWYQLSQEELDEALDRYFQVHHNPALPYHDLPHFRIILKACELCIPDASSPARSGQPHRSRRARGMSRWVRGAGGPLLAAHVPAHCARGLRTISDLEPHLQDAEEELSELLSRAVVIMCIEPAASAALPVWVSWVSRTSVLLVRACLSAVACLTNFQYFAPLADAAVRALLHFNEGTPWLEFSTRWSSCPWREAHALAQGGRAHAAYACAVSRSATHGEIRATLAGLLTANINFVVNEPMIATWICYACRIVLSHTDESRDAQECAATAQAMLAGWAEPPRRSILSVVTMHTDPEKPTAKHRLLCRYAQCVLSPDDVTRRAFSAACSATLGAHSDVSSWAAAPRMRTLLRLAARLWPLHETYFHYELELAPDKTE